MSTIVTPRSEQSLPPTVPRRRPSATWYWVGAGIAIAGLVAGIAFGFGSYVGAMDELDRASMPADVTVNVPQASTQVIYYEGGRDLVFEELVFAVTDPTGTALAVAPYETELIYETPDLTRGRAVATFQADGTGEYRVQVTGIDEGWVAVGPSFARMVLADILMAVALAGLSVALGLTIGLVTLFRRARHG